MDVKNSPTKISTHAPLAGRDLSLFPVSKGSQAFQPTRPLRGATNNRQVIFTLHLISTHAPLAGRDDCTVRAICKATDFNPRAPCGARLTQSKLSDLQTEFQPTRPLRGATLR